MAHRDIVVIGASAGGLHALLDLFAPLPVNLQASIFVVVHTSRDGTGLLPEILARSGASNVAYAKDGETIERSRIYVAPPDHHLLIKRSVMRVVRGPRENRFRPAVDPLFRTAARAFGARVIGIVLSGGLDDGTHGLELIKRHGGIAIAQDPQHAVMPSMPLSAIQSVEVDYILRPSEIGAKLPLLIGETVEDDAALVPEAPDVAEGIQDNLRTGRIPGPPSPFTCPECGGALWELEDNKLLRFQCHVGHGYTGEALMWDQHEEFEHTLWAGLRALEEQAGLRRRMAQHAEHVGRLASAREFERLAKADEVRAASMRRLLLRHDQHGDLRLVEPAADEAKSTERAKRRRGGGR